MLAYKGANTVRVANEAQIQGRRGVDLTTPIPTNKIKITSLGGAMRALIIICFVADFAFFLGARDVQKQRLVVREHV